jgi:glycosyltransferase involved in cell wall biosynthesis
VYKLAILDTQPVQYFAPLYRYLSADPELDVTVYYCSRNGVDDYYDAGFRQRVKWDVPLLEGYKYRFLKPLVRNPTSRFPGYINPSIIGELARNGYHAIWIHGYTYATHLLALAAAKACGTAVFMREDTQLTVDRPKLRGALRRPLMAAFYAMCDRCLAVGSASTRYYRFHGVPERKIRLVPFVVDNDAISDAVKSHSTSVAASRRELGVVDDRPLVVFASKLSANKRPLDVLSAYATIRQRGKPAALMFIGSGAEETSLRQYVEQNDVPDVHFMGFMNQKQIAKFYAIADIGVLASRNERWGLVLNEYMCAGLPLLVSDRVGAIPDLLEDGVNGFAYRCGDISDMVEKLFALVTDSGLRARMGARSKELIDRWSFRECLEGVKAALADVVN